MRNVSRRAFCKLAGVTGGGLVLGFHLPANALGKAARLSGEYEFNAYIQIRPDNTIVLAAQNPEVGQGVKTSMPMIVAEELDADWQTVEVIQSAIDAQRYGRQFAGGSRSIPTRWDALREAGARARQVLLEAAAEKWGVASGECTTRDSHVLHAASGRSLSYGALAQAASQRPLPKTVSLKPRSEYCLLGTRVSGVDNPAIVSGKPLFGVDQVVAGMQYAVYHKCPAIGGTVKSANLDVIRQLPGVSAAFVMDARGDREDLQAGIAIVANSTWAAFSARKQLQVDWDESSAASDSWRAAKQRAAELAQITGQQVIDKGDTTGALNAATHRIDAYYSYPYVAHAPMEPQNCTAHVHNGRCELWAPTQMPQVAIKKVANLLDIDESRVTLHQLRMGGGFGRRLMSDFVCEAAAISERVGTPVKLQWSREDDMAHDFYRVGGFHALSAGLDKAGKLLAWRDHYITFSPDGETTTRGGNQHTKLFPHSKAKNTNLQLSLIQSAIPTGWWRAPISCAVAFANQCFIHELAVAARRDHGEFLLELLAAEDHHSDLVSFEQSRAVGVVKEVLHRANWQHGLAADHFQGLAFYYSHAGYFAHVAEVSVTDNKGLRVHKVTVVGDVGPIVNLSGAENQVEGSVIDGFSTAMGLSLSIENGRVQERNYHQYPLLRMRHAPEVDVHFIQSDNPPTGLGEPALPPTAPAIANAIFAATGERLRSMPFTEAGYSLA